MVNQNPARKSWYALATPENGPAEVMIYDDIGIFGITAADFVEDLATIDADEITVRINSYGGQVFDGIAILNAMRAHPAAITTIVDGVAASIASVIALGGDEVVMNQNSQLMIHNAWNAAVGNADELQRAADALRSMSGNMASIYAAKAGGTPEEWQALMDGETWYTADEAVAAGLADRVVNYEPKAATLAAARTSAAMAKFKYAGREAAPAPRIQPRAQTPQPTNEAEVNQGKEPPVATLNESLVEKLGLAADADDDAILAKIAELAERPEKADPTPETGPAAEPTTEQITAAAAKLGMAMVDKTQYESTVAAVAQMQAERAAQAKAEDERLIDDAITKGKLAPANKANWLALMEKDRIGIRATLAELPAGLIPVAEMGHGTGSELDTFDAELAAGYTAITRKPFGKDA